MRIISYEEGIETMYKQTMKYKCVIVRNGQTVRLLTEKEVRDIKSGKLTCSTGMTSNIKELLGREIVINGDRFKASTTGNYLIDKNTGDSISRDILILIKDKE